jgi:ribonuclease D
MSEILTAVRIGLAVPDDRLPTVKKRKRIVMETDAAVDLCIALVRRRAKEHGVAMPLLASRDELERFVAGEHDGHPLLEGWRRSMVGEELCALLDGSVRLGLRDGELVIEPDGSSERHEPRSHSCT